MTGRKSEAGANFGPRRTEWEEAYLPLKGGTLLATGPASVIWTRAPIFAFRNITENRLVPKPPKKYSKSIFVVPLATKNRFVDHFGIDFGISLARGGLQTGYSETGHWVG